MIHYSQLHRRRTEVASLSTAATVVIRRSLSCGAAVIAILLSAMAGGCDSPEPAGEKLSALRIAVVPDDDPAVLRTQYAPLLNYLERELGVPCELIVPESYDALLQSFLNDEVDLAWFGGVTFVLASRSGDAVPLVCRESDLRFTSSFLVKADDPAADIADFQGKRLAFGSKLSTSGHLMPRHFLNQLEIEPETYFSEVVYTGSHNGTALAVRDGNVDIGVCNSGVTDAMFESGRLSHDDVRILKVTPPFVDYTWACRAGLPSAMRQKLRDAFLNLSPETADQAAILNALDAAYFVPVHREEFESLKSIVDEWSPVELNQ